MKRKILSLALGLLMCLGLCVPAFAYGDTGIAGQANTLTCGYACVAVIDENNSLWMWGDGRGGLMDDKEPAPMGFLEEEWRYEPKKIIDDVLSVSISANQTKPFAAVIKTDHSLWTWGWNDEGQLGNGGKGIPLNGKDYEIFQLKPQKIMDNVAAVSCGFSHAAAIKMDGSLWMWGSNCNNRFNNGSIGNVKVPPGPLGYFETYCQTVPVKVMDGVSWVRCGIGIENPFVLLKDGTLVTWPTYSEKTIMKDIFNQPDEVPVPPKQPLPLQVIAKDVVAVSEGEEYHLSSNVVAYIKKDGSLWTYGNNMYCQLGLLLYSDNDLIRSTNKPQRVWSDVAAVAVCNCYAVAAVTSDGSLMTWGLPSFVGQGKDPLISYTRTGRDINGDLVTVDCCAMKMSVRSAPYVDFAAKVPSALKSTPTVGGFIDVKETDYFADAVQWAVAKKITSGTSANTFGPNATCSKAQILTFLWHANGSPEPTAANPFADIQTGDYFYKAALWAAEKGLVSGSTFGANTDCTRAMTVEYMWKAAGSPAPAGKADFDDVPANADYAQAVAWAVEKNITSGTGDSNFSPAATCTRGQIVTFLYRAMGK